VTARDASDAMKRRYRLVSDMAARKKQMSTVESWGEAPQFATEAEEAEWWLTNRAMGC
jgi:hypothetical protein